MQWKGEDRCTGFLIISRLNKWRHTMPAEPVLSKVSSIAALVRDVGVILGIPVVLTVGIKLYDLQTKALEAQMKAVQAQNEVLKQTQYDRALAMIKSQRELFENERVSLEKQVTNLSTSDKDKSEEIAQLQKRIAVLDVFKRRVDQEDANFQQMLIMLTQMSEKSGGKRRGSAGARAATPRASQTVTRRWNYRRLGVMIVASHSRGITFQEVEGFAKKKGPRFTAFARRSSPE